MIRSELRLGIALMIAASFVFAMQDGISRHLAAHYNVFMVVMIRFWFFGAFVLVVASRRAGGLRAAAATTQPGLQIFRGLLLIVEICVTVMGFVLLGLIPTHAIFASFPLIIAALSGPVLGEKVGPWRWAAIGVGFLGILVILRPGVAVFDPRALIALAAAVLWAVYGVLTRLAARRDNSTTSFFWTGVVGAIGMTLIGIWFWEPMTGPDWGWMAALCITGVSGHWLLIKCYEVVEASAVQPFAYFQLVFVTMIAIPVFGEELEPNVAIGAAMVIGAGVVAVWRERRAALRRAARDAQATRAG
ncbi:MAG: DMT family transporter [Paracoccaceae bacterium]